MFKLLYSCPHFTCQQRSIQNPSSQASRAHELRTSRSASQIQKRQRNQRSNCQHLLDHRKIKGIPKIKSTSASLTMLKPLAVWITTNCGIFLDENTRPPDLPPEKSECRSRSNSQNRTWNNRLFPNWKRSMSRLYIVILLI